jgi:hypothetical protein
MHRAPFAVRISSTLHTAERPCRTAAEAYDGAAAVRRAVGDAGTVLQVADVTSGAILGEWRHDGTCWSLHPGFGEDDQVGA